MAGTSGQLYSPSVKGKQHPSLQAAGFDLPSNTQLWPLGSRIFDETTGTYYKYVQASSAGVAANKLCSAVDATGFVVAQSPASAAGAYARCGVNSGPQASVGPTVAANQYFWMAYHGPALVNASGAGYILGDPIAPDVATAGAVIEHTVAGAYAQSEAIRTGQICGFALQVESGGTVKAFLQRME